MNVFNRLKAILAGYKLASNKFTYIVMVIIAVLSYAFWGDIDIAPIASEMQQFICSK